jgi:hypothetical protein
VARRQRCLAFVVSGGRPSVRGEGRGKRDLSENVGRVFFNLGTQRVTTYACVF